MPKLLSKLKESVMATEPEILVLDGSESAYIIWCNQEGDVEIRCNVPVDLFVKHLRDVADAVERRDGVFSGLDT